MTATNTNKRIKLTNDLPFKRYLLSFLNNNQRVVKNFLEDILGKEIYSIQILPTEISTAGHESKDIRLDLFLMINGKELVSIEMQKKITKEELGKRLRYYASVIQTSSKNKGKSYMEIMPLHQIYLLECNIFDDSRYYHKLEMSEKIAILS